MQVKAFALVVLLCASGALHAEPATARYAPVQLRVARAALDQAEQMLRAGRGEAARRLAAKAALDARLAWAMTDSQLLRNRAAALYGRSARLDLSALTMNSTKEKP